MQQTVVDKPVNAKHIVAQVASDNPVLIGQAIGIYHPVAANILRGIVAVYIIARAIDNKVATGGDAALNVDVGVLRRGQPQSLTGVDGGRAVNVAIDCVDSNIPTAGNH